MAGDVRVNEQVALTSIHTLFMRDTIIGRASMQKKIRMRPGKKSTNGPGSWWRPRFRPSPTGSFFPILLGPRALKRYRGYNPELDAGISNEFAAVAFRVGHTMLSSTLLRLDASGREIEAGHLSLADAFFAPQEVVANGIEPVLRGLAAQPCQEIDNQVVDEVRNFLFGEPGQGGFDLAALNIQRGRDHGIAAYNSLRRNLGLRPMSSFRRLTRDRELSSQLASVYASPDEMDPGSAHWRRRQSGVPWWVRP